MAKTERDIIYKAMRRLRVIGASEEPSAEDYSEALEEYEGFHEWLVKEFPRQIYWNKDNVPVEYWTYLAGWFAGRLSYVIPTGQENKQDALEAANASETFFREMLARKKLQVTPVDFF